MQNVILVIHLILALSLIGVVLLQRSEGGGLGMGGGGGNVGGVMSGRAAATALGRLTWGLAVAFIATSVFLTILAAQRAQDTSVVDRLGTTATDEEGQSAPAETPPAEDLLPPTIDGDGDGPAAPPRAD